MKNLKYLFFIGLLIYGISFVASMLTPLPIKEEPKEEPKQIYETIGSDPNQATCYKKNVYGTECIWCSTEWAGGLSCSFEPLVPMP